MRYFPIYRKKQYVIEACQEYCDKMVQKCTTFWYQKWETTHACGFFSEKGKLEKRHKSPSSVCYRVRSDMLSGNSVHEDFDLQVYIGGRP